LRLASTFGSASRSLVSALRRAGDRLVQLVDDHAGVSLRRGRQSGRDVEGGGAAFLHLRR
jgi:hypothetical protein